MIQWRNGWRKFELKDKEDYFLNELRWEIRDNSKHVLSNRKVSIIGWIPGYDDFLLAFEDASQYAYVHLTWNKEDEPQWPHVEIIADEQGVNDFVREWDQE